MSSIQDNGAQSWLDGKSLSDCPYSDEQDAVDYWSSQAGLRQQWMAGYIRALHNDSTMRMCEYLPEFRWAEME